MAPTLTITYKLNPPSDTPAPPSLSPSQTLQYRIPEASGAGHKAYYEKLRAEVLQAKSALGEELTAWRDVVGKREENKEATVVKKSEEEEEEEEDIDGDA